MGRPKFPSGCFDIVVSVIAMIGENVLDLKLGHTWISHLRSGRVSVWSVSQYHSTGCNGVIQWCPVSLWMARALRVLFFLRGSRLYPVMGFSQIIYHFFLRQRPMLPLVSFFPSFRFHRQALLYDEGNIVEAISLILHEQSLEHKTRLLILAMLNCRIRLTLETPCQI